MVVTPNSCFWNSGKAAQFDERIVQPSSMAKMCFDEIISLRQAANITIWPSMVQVTVPADPQGRCIFSGGDGAYSDECIGKPEPWSESTTIEQVDSEMREFLTGEPVEQQKFSGPTIADLTEPEGNP